MWSNYLKVALRNLWKHRSFSAINIAGLAIGMAACLLILQYVSFKLSFDQFNVHLKDIYRVVNDRYQNGKLIQHGTITYSGVGKAMNDDYEEVIRNARVVPSGETIISYGDKKLAEDQVLYVDEAFFSVFSYPLLAGDASTTFQEPYAVVLSESLAGKLFNYKGNEFQQFIGKQISLLPDTMLYQVEAICKDVPEHSHLNFELLISYPTLISNGWEEAGYNFTQSDFWHYVQLTPGTDYLKLNEKMPAFSQTHFQGNKVSGSDEKFYLQPLGKAHLYSDFEYEIGRTGSATVVWGLLLIALFIIGIAWINYINLATARAVDRAKEVGVRKVAGSTKGQLITQFLTESLLVNGLGILLALLIVLLVQRPFNTLLEHKLSLVYLFSKGMSGYGIPIGLGILVLTGVAVSGFYPAFVLSSFKPISVLKGKFQSSRQGILFRKGLVIGQFSITIALIIGSIIVMRQLRYMNRASPGFDMDQVMIVQSPSLTSWDTAFISRVNNFKQELKRLVQVKGATTSWNLPGGDIGRSFNVRRADSSGTDRYTMRHTSVDFDFVPMFSIPVLAGRSFRTEDHHWDGQRLQNIMINASAARMLGFESPEAAVGKSIYRGQKKWEVIGVLGDYHQKSLRFPLEPMLFLPYYSTNSDIAVKLNPSGNFSQTISLIREKYEAFFPGNLFDYTFLDEVFNRQYQSDRLFGRVFGIFAGLAIGIACLGLLGLTMFSTVQRTREIGVRKVLGASVASILILISRDFIKLVLIAAFLAFPIAGWVMKEWLDDFAFRINMGWEVFIIAGSGALLIALFTISYQAIKAARANPVKALRTE
ncbi:MAG TPA: ABC transporter permease [Saprospiraceae bacterium]|nr:ABC transporter permease [Saprospiraceae bacterium]HNT21569.1 ABC transporter permease [Saprospiraceae bacterium]